MAEKYIVRLTEDEKKQMQDITGKGKNGARKIKRANILLIADKDRTDREIAEILRTGVSTVARVRKRFVEGGPGYALNENPRPGKKRILNGKQEAFLVAQACSSPPDGRSRWTMQMLADRLIELKITESVSDETVRRTLKKMK